MKTARIDGLLMALALLTILPCSAQAQLKLPFRSQERPQNESLELTESAGPWLIMCASFVGEEGAQKAKMLAHELRQHKLKTYIYRHSFDFSQPVQGLGWDDKPGEDFLPQPKRMKVANYSRLEETAVLVGDFPTNDDARAQKTLNQIKTMQVASMQSINTDSIEGQIRLSREIGKRISSDAEDKLKGPMGSAFLLTNPLLPDEYFQREPVDSFVMKLNRGIKFSLLDCPGPYTVQVATFRGDSTFELEKMKELEAEQGWRLRFRKPVRDRESKLVVAAAKAHRLTQELRKMGVEAYEFHDRYESMVCVGSFDWLKRGSQQNPEIVAVINRYKATIEDLPMMPGAVRPKTIPSLKKFDIAFDPQPIPVAVPKPAQTHTSSRFNPFK